MTGRIITVIKPLETFDRDYKKLSPELKIEVKERLRELLQNPMPKSLRFKPYTDKKLPLFAIHVTGNHSHKISMLVKGSTATLRRVNTHKKIDRNP